MKVLSIYWGICASASIFIDGKVVAATHEERYTRIKNDDSFPENAINYCLSEAGISASELDLAVIASNIQEFNYQVTRHAKWSVEDYLKEQINYWKPMLYDKKKLDYLEVFDYLKDYEQYPKDYWKANENNRSKFYMDRTKILAQYLGINPNKCICIEHHRCHAAYAYYVSPFRGEEVLAFTIDGSGDGLNATIGIYDKNGHYTRVYETDQCFIGRIYRYITLLLGMKPNEHEFKVMGLAPYGKAKYAKKAYEVFASTLYVDGIEFKWKQKPTDSYFWFKERLEGIRFDNIAWGLQKWVEDLLTEWIRNAINKFKISKIIIAGGVSMNIKAMGKISYLPEVQDIFIGGSASDESMAISAGICAVEDKDVEFNPIKMYPIQNLYLGQEASLYEEQVAIENLDSSYTIIDKFNAKDIATLLANSAILARCAGRMEFGQRALGNRSILADPSNLRVRDTINDMIKNRDFWMPFAPIVMDKYMDIYLQNPKKIFSPYMTIGFDTTSIGYEAMIAACHPADKSARPQMLTKDLNQNLYMILEEFEKIRGIGALLNTSFNLHGYPIVNTPSQAIYVLKNSGLDGLILNNFIVLKK
ncbi:carbamoyltransferase C-terminal domain-containing protein [Campylobacter hyointestinalis]|uniref:carbamoyltransferase C-terminal domain-containing protein n=2 Tax=Campylobacter hyointestinalis TaxID=198 RepID=UPI0004D4E263|nr:carbamoyltransferase C-terminal domain-containing protein [Campylobacter hyointestinalis]KEA44060.1 carbamoyl transferase [Campylobacter hyointestinalis subsp. hyointestinalis]PPB57863.1 carbamoyl transferase [Campylobacter hyointestinalis subsp. hyointestinalis]PPB64432.1 carbamoyl transferase [Campylobacter hyointestinalis subsp. hyointestinalis]QKF54919.1 carbamoyltransferase, NodU family [Campylobacter hyointestinalis subsp. hyointestinalis]TXK47842.1 carbamoyl transferase [Campylobacte